MFTNICPSPELEVVIKRAQYRTSLADLSDEDLFRVYKSAEERFGNKKLNPITITMQPEEFYMGLAAVDILRERHGDGMVEAVTGITQPKTLVGKVIRYLF